jgi:membrane protein required for colicin V production
VIFSFVDVLYTVLILTTALIAAFHGFLREFFTKLAVILGLGAAFLYAGRLAWYIEKVWTNRTADTIIAFLIIFIVVYLFVRIIQQGIAALFSGEILSGLDHVLGFFLGIAEGCIIVAAIMIFSKSQPWLNLTFFTERSFYYTIVAPYLSGPVVSLSGMFA